MVFSEISIVYSGEIEKLKYDMVNYFYLCNLVNRKMYRFRVSNYKKVVIHLIETDVIYYYDQQIKKNQIINLFEGISEYWIDFDSKDFQLNSLSEKEKSIWNILKSVLRIYAEQDGWDKVGLEEIINGIEQSGCRNEYNLGEFLINKNKNLAGQIQIIFDSKSFRVYGIIKNVLTQKESKQLVLQWEPAKGYSNDVIIRKQKWFDDERFGIQLLNGVEFSVKYLQD